MDQPRQSSDQPWADAQTIKNRVAELTEHEEDLRLLELIRNEPAWALSRVKMAVALEEAVREHKDGNVHMSPTDLRLWEVANV